MRVCLVIEGSYPYITGGVSSWVHELIGGLPDIEFSLFTMSPKADQQPRYTLHANVKETVDVVLTKAQGSVGLKNDRRRVRGILEAHRDMFEKRSPDLAALVGKIPEGVSIRRESVLDRTAWRFIIGQNRSRNPIYAFADYFWAWKSSHDLIFNALGAVPPKADIYHSLSTGFAGLAALAAARRHGKPFILTEHGLYHKEREIEIRKASFVRGYQRDLWIGIYNSIARLCYENAGLCTSLFEENRGYQLELGATPERTVVIPNGVDTARFAVERRPRARGRHVGFVGRIVPIKDVKTFIGAAKIVLESVPDAEFHLVGPEDEDPDYAEDCHRLAEDLGIAKYLHFVGRANVLDYYGFLDVLVLTSVREAQPLVILEAFAAGIPCVSTDVGNVSELLEGDSRLIAPSKDAEGIARGILYVLGHPREMKDLVERNRARVTATYEKKELLARYGSLYDRFAPIDPAMGRPDEGGEDS
ncbi:MAG TPA: GT4 family glycosyltransferase PelF [Rectinemataceae bacterium]|nr:GT4 family glycosyltransferase PelF [Rectinemataceae bacterium]